MNETIEGFFLLVLGISAIAVVIYFTITAKCPGCGRRHIISVNGLGVKKLRCPKARSTEG